MGAKWKIKVSAVDDFLGPYKTRYMVANDIMDKPIFGKLNLLDNKFPCKKKSRLYFAGM